MAAARANRRLGHLAPHKEEAIDRACIMIVDGRHHDQFVVDAVQGGAGTSTNMNGIVVRWLEGRGSLGSDLSVERCSAAFGSKLLPSSPTARSGLIARPAPNRILKMDALTQKIVSKDKF
jgi:hypothetical protein